MDRVSIFNEYENLNKLQKDLIQTYITRINSSLWRDAKDYYKDHLTKIDFPNQSLWNAYVLMLIPDVAGWYHSRFLKDFPEFNRFAYLKTQDEAYPWNDEAMESINNYAKAYTGQNYIDVLEGLYPDLEKWTEEHPDDVLAQTLKAAIFVSITGRVDKQRKLPIVVDLFTCCDYPYGLIDPVTFIRFWTVTACALDLFHQIEEFYFDTIVDAAESQEDRDELYKFVLLHAIQYVDDFIRKERQEKQS